MKNENNKTIYSNSLIFIFTKFNCNKFQLLRFDSHNHQKEISFPYFLVHIHIQRIISYFHPCYDKHIHYQKNHQLLKTMEVGFFFVKYLPNQYLQNNCYF